MEPPENIQVVIRGDAIADLTNSSRFSNQLKLAALAGEHVVVDLRNTRFIDTRIVHDLATAAITLLRRDKRLKVLTAEKTHPLRVLRISDFWSIMDISIEKEK